MIQEQYVEFETAKLLKEKGFPQHITNKTYFIGDDKKRGCVVGEFIEHPSTETDNHLIDAPTQQIVMRWLREEHNIHIAIVIGADVDNPNYIFYLPSIAKFSKANIKYIDPFGEDEFDSCEQAAEAAIQYCLKNLL